MAEQEQREAGNPKKQGRYRGNRYIRGGQTGVRYKGKVEGLEDDIFDVGASSNPAKFSKSLKNIETYIQKTYKSPDDIVKTLQKLTRPTLNYPEKPKKADYKDENGDEDPDAFEMAVFAWKEDYKSMRARKDKYQDNESNAWALIYDQCSPELKNKLEGGDGYEKCKSGNDVGALLIMICSYCCQFDTLNDEYVSIVGAIKNLFFYWQKPEQTNADYHEDFMALVKVIEEYGGPGSLSHFPNMIAKEIDVLFPGIDISNATSDQMKRGKKVVRDKFLAVLMLNGANGQKYGELKRSIAENYVTGTSAYPDSPEVVLHILTAYKPPVGWNKRRGQEAGTASEEGAMFAQADGGNWKENVKCRACGKKGHIARECPNKNDETAEGEQMHTTIQADDEDLDQGDNIFVQQEVKGIVNKNYILLDNQSTVDQIANPKLLKNIRKANKPITVHCNAGSTATNLEGELGSMTVKHNPHSIANVLSLHSIKQKHRVTYDSWDRDGVFQVHTTGGVVEFKPSPRGLHYLDRADEDSKIEYMLVNTVRENFEGFTKHEIEKATEARRLQGMIGHPTEREFTGMVREKLITNCPVTVHDINNANLMYGPDLANLRGKQTRTKPERVRVEIVQIPRNFDQLHKYVTLVVDMLPCQEG